MTDSTHNGSELTVSELEQWLWDAACEIRGPLDAPKFKDYILPLVFLKRLSDVFEDEIVALGEEFGSEGVAQDLVEGDHDIDCRIDGIGAMQLKSQFVKKA